MIDMLKRHEVQVLRRAGHSLPEVAKLAGVSVRSVQPVDDTLREYLAHPTLSPTSIQQELSL